MTDQQLSLYKKYKKYKLKYREALGGASASETIEVLTTKQKVERYGRAWEGEENSYKYETQSFIVSPAGDDKLTIPNSDSSSFYNDKTILRFKGRRHGIHLIILDNGYIYSYKEKKGSDNQPIELNKLSSFADADIIFKKNKFWNSRWKTGWVLKIGNQKYNINSENKTQIKDHYMSDDAPGGTIEDNYQAVKRNYYNEDWNPDFEEKQQKYIDLPTLLFNHWEQSLKNTFRE